MIPEWLVIAAGIAVILCVAGGWIVLGLAAVFAALCGVLAGVIELVDRLLRLSGFYRWRVRRRIRNRRR